MKVKFLELVLGLLTVAVCAFGDPDPNFHIYIAYGQSNMAGAGEIRDGIDNIEHPRYKMFATTTCTGTSYPLGLGAVELNRTELYGIYPAMPPMFHCSEGLGVADWFGRYMADSLPDVTVGIIPVAVGATRIELFDKDRYLAYLTSGGADFLVDKALDYGIDGNAHERIVETAKRAMKVGVIKGIIFHQGESGAMDENDWITEVRKTHDDILEALNLSADSVPFLAGEMVDDAAGGCCYDFALKELSKLPYMMENTYIVKSTGLKSDGKGPYHFSGESYQEFGRRYAEAMLLHANVRKKIPHSPFKGKPLAIPGKIEMEDFDVTGVGLGNESYSEHVSFNLGDAPYRSDPVDIYSNKAGGYAVGFTEVGEWLKYTVDVEVEGAYDLVINVASGVKSGAFRLYIDDEPITDLIEVPKTGEDWSLYKTVSARTTSLKPGRHVLKFLVLGFYFNIDYIEFRTTKPADLV